MTKNSKNTLAYFMRFFGLNVECVDQLKEEERYITYKLVPLENKKIGFEVTSKGKVEIVTPEQVLAFFMKKLKEFYI
jgi:molecular chaperone DnaK (HSP70)